MEAKKQEVRRGGGVGGDSIVADDTDARKRRETAGMSGKLRIRADDRGEMREGTTEIQ